MIGAKSLLKKSQNKFVDYKGIQRGINVDNLKSAIDVVEIVYNDLSNSEEFDWDLVPVLKG